MCVRNVDDQGVLQFTLIHAVGCVLHRRGSRAIHRLQLFLSFQLVSRAGERREASTDPSLEWSGKEEKRKKKKREESRRSRASTKGAGLVRASRPGSLPPTDTDSNVLDPPLPPAREEEIRSELPLATWTPGRPRVQGHAALLQTADRPEGDGLDTSHSHHQREPRYERGRRE